MKYLCAYLLAVLSGNEKPDAACMKKILTSVGITPDEKQIERILKDLGGKDLGELIAKGGEKMASAMPAGAPAAAAATGTTDKPGTEDVKKEVKKEEKEESEDEDMGFDLFD